MKTMEFLEEKYGPDRIISNRCKNQRRDGMMFYPPSSPQVLEKYKLFSKMTDQLIMTLSIFHNVFS